MSCSDPDMNSPDDCDEPQGDGKDGKSKGASPVFNEWFIVSLVADEGGLVCPGNDPNNGSDGDSDDDGDGTVECTITSNNPNCDSTNPDQVSWKYSGGSVPSDQCASSTIRNLRNDKGKEHEDFTCGPSNVSGPISVQGDKDFVGNFVLGDAFTMDLKEIKGDDSHRNKCRAQRPIDDFPHIMLSGTVCRILTRSFLLYLVSHDVSPRVLTCCLQPLEVGMTAGALTLVGFDNRRGSNEVTYFYEVRNVGADATNVVITDNQIEGEIGFIPVLLTGESVTLPKSVILETTTTNIATAVGTSSGGECRGTSNPVEVTVIHSSGGSSGSGSSSRR